MSQNVLLVAAADVLVVNRLAGLGIHPADVERAVLETTVEVLDEAHHPRHLDAAFDGKLATSLHLPAGTRATPWAHLRKPGDDNDLLQVQHATKLRKLGERLRRLKSGEVELEVGTGSDVDGLQHPLSLDTVHSLEVGGIVAGDSTTELALLLEVAANTDRDLRQVGETIHTAIQVGPDRLNLGNAEDEGVHEAENVEGHLLRRERAHSVALEFCRNGVGRFHQASTTSPAVQQKSVQCKRY